MKKVILAFAFLLLAGAAWGQPSITSVSGWSGADGDTLTIAGSGFGTHDLRISWGVGPNGWLEQQADGVDMNNLVDATGWTAGFSTGGAPATVDTTTFGYRVIEGTIDRQLYPSAWQRPAAYNAPAVFDTLYVSWQVWYKPIHFGQDAIRYDPPLLSPGCQWKHWWVSADNEHAYCAAANEYSYLNRMTSPSYDVANFQIFTTCCGRSCPLCCNERNYAYCIWDAVPDTNYDWIPDYTSAENDPYMDRIHDKGGTVDANVPHPSPEGWNRIELLLISADVDSANGEYNCWVTKPGEARYFVDRLTKWRTHYSGCTDNPPRPGQATDPWEWFGLHGFWDAQDEYQDGQLVAAWTDEKMEIYYKDIYIQRYTPARIEIANASTLAAATQIVPQLPTSWSPTSINMALDLDGMDPLDAYVFVTDSTSTAGTGVPLVTACESICTDAIHGNLKPLQFVGHWAAAVNGGTMDAYADTITTVNPWTRRVTFNTGVYNVDMTITSPDTLKVSPTGQPGLLFGSAHNTLLDNGGCIEFTGLPNDWSERQQFCGPPSLGSAQTLSYTAWVEPDWISDWAFRQLMTADASLIGTANAMTDFPVVVLLDSSNSGIFTKANSDGSDIRFYNPDGLVAYDYELVSWDASAQTAEFWVKIPAFSKLDNTMWIYYGNGTAVSASTNTVWSDYEARYHFVDNPSGGTLTDASPNGANASTTYVRPQEVPEGFDGGWATADLVDAKLGKGWVYENYQTTNTTGIQVINDPPQWSVGAWLYHTNVGTDFLLQWDPWFARMASQAADTAPSPWYQGGYFGEPDFQISYLYQERVVPLNAWHHYLFVYDGSVPSIKFYFDGTEVLNPATNVGFTVPAEHFINVSGSSLTGVVGPMYANVQDGMDGIADEFFLIPSVLPVHEITTMYNNQNDPSVFWSFSVEKTP